MNHIDKIDKTNINNYNKILIFTVSFCFVIIISFWMIFRICGAHIPKNYKIGGKNICIGFAGNIGSGEFVYFYSYKCNEINQNNYIFETKQYLDIGGTIECPIFDYFESGEKIVITQDWLCDQFAHVESYEPCEQTITIKDDGTFEESTSFKCNKVKSYLGF